MKSNLKNQKEINKLIEKSIVSSDKKVQKDKQLIAEIPYELHMEIKILATRKNITMKEVVENALTIYLESQRMA